jgi:beta-lactam-binding protein with PASTA domain
MGNIFISYRREDSAGHSGRLFDKLRERFGKDRVFMDIAGIEPGVDFVEAIEKAVGSCDAFIVVIGKQWLSATDADGQRRLDSPEDFIRLEIATALKRKIRVIPVLVQGATAPSSGSLPEDLRKLSRLQAHEISDNRWDFDVGTLIETLEKVLKKEVPEDQEKKEEKKEEKVKPVPPPQPSKFPRWVIAATAAIAIAIGVYALWPRGKPTIQMPNVVGAPFEEAKAILIEKGLVISKEERQTHEKAPGIVIGQRPKPGTEVERGQRVDLILAVKTVTKMPNVVEKRIEEAEGTLLKAGLAISEVKEIKTNERSPGIVLKQTPKAGMEVEPGQKVRLEVAVKSGISVPDVIGKSFGEARTILAGMGLEVLKIEKQTDERRPGTVLDQNPRPGKEIEKGQKVELVIAVPKPVPPPKPSPPQIHSFKPDPSDILYGQSCTLRWETSNSVLLRLEDSRGWSLEFRERSGSYRVTPTSSETYVLIAEGEGGSRLRQAVNIRVRVPCEGRGGRITVLRSRPGAFTREQIRRMILERGFREHDSNPNGDFQNLYEVYEQVVVDCATGLMWQRSGSEAKEWSWQTAPNYVRRLNAEKFAGFNDWRLPTIEELSSLLEPKKSRKGLFINDVFDEKTDVWSSDDRIETGTPQGWSAGFDYGGIFHGGAKTNRFFVRAVRSLR